MRRLVRVLAILALIAAAGVIYFWSSDTKFFLSGTAGLAVAMGVSVLAGRIVRINSLRSTFSLLAMSGFIGGATFGLLSRFYPLLSAILGAVLLPLGYWADSGLEVGDPRLILRRRTESDEPGRRAGGDGSGEGDGRREDS